MNNIRKRKILIFAICVLCVLIFASVFLAVLRWLHSEGLHFIAGYGQIHLSKMCEGIDQDGNKIQQKNIVIDGVVTKEKGDNQVFRGMVDIIAGLPEGVIQANISPVIKYDNGLYELAWCPFLDAQISFRVFNGERKEDRSCEGIVWIKDGEIVMKFYQGDDDTNGYYIYYSDVEMLDIKQIQYCINKNIK